MTSFYAANSLYSSCYKNAGSVLHDLPGVCDYRPAGFLYPWTVLLGNGRFVQTPVYLYLQAPPRFRRLLVPCLYPHSDYVHDHCRGHHNWSPSSEEESCCHAAYGAPACMHGTNQSFIIAAIAHSIVKPSHSILFEKSKTGSFLILHSPTALSCGAVPSY